MRILIVGLVTNPQLMRVKEEGKKLDSEIEKIKADIEKMPESAVINFALRSITKQLSKQRKVPRLFPPYLFQFPGYVLFRNKISDGDYPVVKTRRRLYIIHNIPIKSKDGKSFECDTSRLEGEVLGWSSVDGGLQVVTDAEGAGRIFPSIASNAYCTIEVPKGSYVCHFVENGWKLSIRKIREERAKASEKKR